MVYPLVGEDREPGLPGEYGDSCAEGHTELGVDDVAGLAFLFDGVGDQPAPSAQDAAGDARDVPRVWPLTAHDVEEAVNRAVHIATAGVGFERDAHDGELVARLAL